MKLHRERLPARKHKAFYGPVIDAAVENRQTCPFEGCTVHLITMVLTGDEDLPASMVSHRIVSTAMAELHLPGLGSGCQRKKLMTHADAEERNLAQEFFHRFNGNQRILRISRTV